MHLIKSSQEDAFVHSKTLFVKSKIIWKQFMSLNIFAADIESIDFFKPCTRSFSTLAPRTRNYDAGHHNYDKKTSLMQIIFQS